MIYIDLNGPSKLCDEHSFWYLLLFELVDRNITSRFQTSNRVPLSDYNKTYGSVK